MEPRESMTTTSGSRRTRTLHRGHPERKLTGVAAALADALDLPVVAVRAGFLIGAIVPSTSAMAIGLYLVLWFLLPPAPQAESGLDRTLEAVRELGRDTGLLRDRDEPGDPYRS